jgi:transposase-like protein
MSFIPSLCSLHELFYNDVFCDAFLIREGIIYETLICEKCGSHMKRQSKRFQCPRDGCRSEKSLYFESFFAKSKLSPSQILLIGYFWLTGTPFNLVCTFTGHSRETISSFYKHFRQLIVDDIEDDDTKVGGPGVVVEIDESKFGKRKYQRGHRVEGCWVLGGVERTEQRKVFALTVPNRSAATLLNAIKEHVHEGSIIYTDLWKGYSQLNADLGFGHFTVNHSQFFRDPISGVDTNMIEGTWNGMKMKIAPRCRVKQSLNERLLEFIWKRRHYIDLWNGLISALKSNKYL